MTSVRVFKRVLSATLSLQLAVMPTMGWSQSSVAKSAAAQDDQMTAELQKEILLNHFAMVENEMPGLTRLGYDEELNNTPMWNIESGPLLDANPFFMAGQTWESAPTQDEVFPKLRSVFRKDAAELVVGMGGLKKSVRLPLAMSPLIETVEYIFLSADDDKIFRDKSPGEAQPGEGLFFIAKKDLIEAAASGDSVPVFHFPLPGAGWTGLEHGFELVATDSIVVYNKNKEAITLARADVAQLEDIQRANLTIAQTWSVLEGQAKLGGKISPRPNTTMLFGVYLSGQKPAMDAKYGAQSAGEVFRNLARSMKGMALPEAHADEPKKSGWQRWLVPGGLWAGFGLFTVHAYDKIDWANLIAADMATNALKVTGIVGAVFATSVVLKYKLHKQLFEEKYPKQANETLGQKINREHKGIFDEFAHAQWASLSGPGQTVRTLVNALKDRVFPDNKAVEKAWDETMGWQMRQNSKLPMNYRTFWYGSIVHGMSDSVQVAAFLLVIIPYVYHQLGIEIAAGSATAAFVSAEIIRNFLGYLQSGAHDYSAEVKMIQQNSVEREVKRKMLAEGRDPESSKYRSEYDQRVVDAMDVRFRTLGLPGENEFLYDPVSIIEKIMKKAGFGSKKFDTMSGEDFEFFRDRYGIGKDLKQDKQDDNLRSKFVLSKKRWGLVKPSLSRALESAKAMQAQSPSEVGAKVVQTLEWALENKNLTPQIVGKAWDAAASDWGAQEFKDTVNASLSKEFIKESLTGESRAKHPVRYLKALVHGSLNALVADGTRKARDIRSVLYLMSSPEDPAQLYKFFPDSWKEKAGSDQAALLAANLFHTSFFSLMEHKKEMALPKQESKAKFGEAAARLTAQLAAKDPSLNDPFARLAKENEITFKMQARHQARAERLNYRPDNLGWYGNMQMERARRAGDLVMAAYDADASVSPEWKELADRYKVITGEEIDEEQWIRSYQKRMVYAREIAKRVGLTVEDAQQSELVRKVIQGASVHTEAQLGKPKEKAYLKTLNEDDRLFYEAQVFSNHFINSYVEHSVSTHDHVKASSPEYPGRLQFVRRAIVGMPGEKTANFLTRTVEALFRNEDTSYRPGLLSMVDRSLPLLADSWHNLTRTARVMPYLFAFGYPISYHVWQIKMPFSLYVSMVTFGAVGTALVEFNNRLMKNHGIKPMDDLPSKLTYSWVHGILTNSTLAPVMQFSQPMSAGFDNYVVKPVKGLAADGCELLLGSGKK